MPSLNLAQKGIWVRIGRNSGAAVQGWLIGEIPQGILVALDEEANDVQVVSDYTSISYDISRVLPSVAYGNAVDLRDELEEVNISMLLSVRRAVSRIKFELLHQFCHRSTELVYRIHEQGGEIRANSEVGDELIRFLAAQADRSTELHRGIFEVLQDSGMTEILDEFGPRLARLPPDITIPAYDLEFQSRRELTISLQATRDKVWSSQNHRTLIEDAEETRIHLVAMRAKGLGNSGDLKAEKADDSTFFSRWAGPSLRILAGTGLAAMNASIGITAGLTATVTTIGATAVPTYVGVVTSIYTGLSQVSDGLEKIGRRKKCPTPANRVWASLPIRQVPPLLSGAPLMGCQPCGPAPLAPDQQIQPGLPGQAYQGLPGASLEVRPT